MRKLVAQLAHVVPVRAESDKTFFVQVHFHWAHLSNEDVDAHIPLNSTDEQRLADILLYDALLVVL